MNQQEMRTKYTKLYNYMSESKNPAYMKLFGSVMNEMMDQAIATKPEMAQDWIDKLCSIKWDNYLTPKEAEKIVAGMNPKAPWSREVWRNAMESFGLDVEEEPYYNSCALWVAMNMIYTDSSKTIAMIMGKNMNDVSAEEMVRAIHALAIDKLKDEDGVFNIRTYFGL